MIMGELPEVDDDEEIPDHIDIDGTIMSKAQVERQNVRIKEAMFENHVDYEDGGYSGQLKPEVLEIFHTNLVFNEVMSEDQVGVIIGTIIESISEWIMENVSAVHPIVAKAFGIDFVPRCVEQFFNFESVAAPPDPHDPAYG